MFVHGAISFPGAIVRILAQLAAGVVAYPLLQKLSPSYVGVGGPCLQDGVSTTTGALAEFTLTFALLTLIYLAITIIGAPGQVRVGDSQVNAKIFYVTSSRHLYSMIKTHSARLLQQEFGALSSQALLTLALL